MQINYSKPQPIATLSLKRLERVWTDSEGRVRRERPPEIPLWERMVTPSGNVVFLQLATGRTIRAKNASPYYYQIRGEKLAKGWLPLAECPVAKGHASFDNKPCSGTFTDDEPCRHVKKAIRVRLAAQKERHEAAARNWRPHSQRTLDLMERVLGQNPGLKNAQTEHAE